MVNLSPGFKLNKYEEASPGGKLVPGGGEEF